MVLVVGLPLVLLIWVFIYVETPVVTRWVGGMFSGADDAAVVDGSAAEQARAASEQAAAYVRQYVSIETETSDRRLGDGTDLRLEVRVRLRNVGTQTVSGVKARVLVQLVPSMGEAVVQTRTPLAVGDPLGPGDRREFTVVFDGLRPQPGDEAAIRVELMEPELEV